jgi:regulator of protease activity HflC (stomatin/prohibitin superfamily)
VFWRYDEARIADIVRNFQRTSVDEILLRNAVQELRTVIGEYTVFDLAANTANIAQAALATTVGRVQHLPIIIIDMMIEDFDWSPEVDRIVEQRVVAMASVDRARAEADRVEQEQRRVSIEAEAQARATIARAEADLRAAQLGRQARIEEGQGIAEYNRLVAQNQALEIQLRRLEIERIEAERWDGRRMPTYIPLNPAGGIVTLPATPQGTGR